MTFEEILQQNGLDQFLADLGLVNLTPEKKKEYTDQIARILKNNLILAVESALTDADQEKTSAMSPDEFMDFMQNEKGVDMLLLTAQIADEFRTDMIQNMAYIKGSLGIQN